MRNQFQGQKEGNDKSYSPDKLNKKIDNDGKKQQ